MPIIDLRSLAEPPAGVEVYRNLKDSQLRARTDAEHGIYLAESTRVVRRALTTGHRLLSMLVAERYLDSLADITEAHPEVPVYVADDQRVKELTGFHVHRGALAAFARPEPLTLESLLDARRLIFADGIATHENLGTIIRTGVALGWDGLVLSRTAADPYYRRTLRASMGAVFSMPFARIQDSVEALTQLKDAGFSTVALELTDQAVDLEQFSARLRNHPDTKLTLVLGAEGPGISPEVLDTVDVHVQIPQVEHHEAATVDSMNVAQAAAIALWELR